MAPLPSPVEEVQARLIVAGNDALRIGARWGLLIGAAAVVLLPVLMAFEAAHDLEGPVLFAAACTAFCTALLVLSRRHRVRGTIAYAVFVPFASLPTILFAATHAALPSGAATFLTGPASYLYFIIIVLSGFLFDFTLSTVVGAAAGLGYAGCFFLARPALASLSTPYALLLQDLTSPAIYLIKAALMLSGGLTVGALALVARRLVVDLLREERERELVGRLFGQYVSAEVKDRILSDPEAKRGERRDAVVLFSDIRGFSSYSEHHSPEEVVERLNEYFDAMVEAITRHRGVVDKFVGDAVMAVFDGVLPHPEPALAAVRAARDMRTALARLNRGWRAAGVEPFENGIGIHAGEVVLGAIGSEHRRDFTVIGDAVNTAARLEELTKARKRPILLTDRVRAALPETMREQCEPLGVAEIRGRSATVELFGLADEPAADEPMG